MRRRPYSLVLFDEAALCNFATMSVDVAEGCLGYFWIVVTSFMQVEKAHPDVFNILLQLLDDGRQQPQKTSLSRQGLRKTAPG